MGLFAKKKTPDQDDLLGALEKQLRKAGDNGLAGLAKLLPGTDANGLQTGMVGTTMTDESTSPNVADQEQASEVSENTEKVKNKNWTMNISDGAQLSFANNRLTLYVDSEQRGRSTAASAISTASESAVADSEPKAADEEKKEVKASTPAAGMAFKPNKITGIDDFSHKTIANLDDQASVSEAAIADTHLEAAENASSDSVKMLHEHQDDKGVPTSEINEVKPALKETDKNSTKNLLEENKKLPSVANPTDQQLPADKSTTDDFEPGLPTSKASENQPSIKHIILDQTEEQDQVVSSSEKHGKANTESEAQPVVMVAIQALQEQNQTNQKQIAALSEKLTQHLETSNELERSHIQMVNKLSESLINLIVTKSELEQTKIDLNVTNDVLAKIRKQVDQTREKRLSRQNIQDEAQQTPTTELKTKLQEAQKAIEVLKNQYAESQKQTKMLQDKVNSLRFDNLRLQHQIEDGKINQA